MPEQKQIFENKEQAEQYVENVRAHYREEHSAYAGNRTKDQQIIAEVTSEEARMIADGVLLGLMSIGSLAIHGEEVDITEEDKEEFKVAGHSWNDFRYEYERLLVGFGVITNRLEKADYDVVSYADMALPDRLKVASVLFGDYLKHNALRFGVDTADIKGTSEKYIETRSGDMIKQKVIIDKDKATRTPEILQNMRQRGFTSGDTSITAAGKLSPKDYIELRRAYPNIRKDYFDFIVGSATNARKQLDSLE